MADKVTPKEKKFVDVFTVVGTVGGALVGLGAFAINALKSGKKFAEMHDEKKKEDEEKLLEDKTTETTK